MNNHELCAFVVPRLVKQRQCVAWRGPSYDRATCVQPVQPLARARALRRLRSSSAAMRCLARVPR